MTLMKSLIKKTRHLCLAGLLSFIVFMLASPVQAMLDNDGQISGLFVSLFAPGAMFPATEYIMAFPGSDGTGSSGTSTDLQGIYHNVAYRTFDSLSQEELDELMAISGLEEINGLELFIIGEYTNSRSLNFTIYDNHSVVTDKILDIDADPISDSYSNPFSTIYSENRFPFDISQPNYYAVKIRLGDSFIDEDSIDPSCSFSNYNVDSNVLDGTVRHGLEDRWLLKTELGELLREFDPGLDPGPNLGGHFGVRRYGDMTPEDPNPHMFKPILLLRETSTGCPIPFRTMGEGGEYEEYDITHRVVTNQGFGEHIPGAIQVQHMEFHNDYANLYNGLYYAFTPEGRVDPVPVLDPNNNVVYWSGVKPYAAAINPFLGYVVGRFFYDWMPVINDEYSNPVDEDPLVLVMHVKIPTEPGFPCEEPGPDGCPGAVGSHLRYWSLTLNDINAEAVYSFGRDDLEEFDEVNRIATIVFSFLDTGGEPFERPPELTSRFNWAHVPSEYPGENPEAPFDIATIIMRMQLSDESDCFDCSVYNVPPGFGEHTPEGVIGSHVGGGFMGDYAPQTLVLRLSTLVMYQDNVNFNPDTVGGDCTTTYDPYEHPDEWEKLLWLPVVIPH